jgi:phosphatidylserine/phosphatidylglycerophosphate/cardiolipin synthase-like enzyme
MNFIDIKENLNTIISLVENAEKYLILISPFNDFNGWDKLKNAINKATARGVDIKYYVREGEGFNGMDGLNVNLWEVPGLHAKLYQSEKDAYISSGNLTNDTNINWYIKLNQQETKDIVEEFYRKQILPVAIPFNDKLNQI